MSREASRRLVERPPDGILISQGALLAFANQAAARQSGVDDSERRLGRPTSSGPTLPGAATRCTPGASSARPQVRTLRRSKRRLSAALRESEERLTLGFAG